MVLRPAITAQIKEILKENPQGLSITDIVDVVKINRNTAGRYLESLLVSGQVEMRHFGMAKMYTLSHRVPVSAVLSISSELILQLDTNLRIIYANGPFLSFLDTSSQDLFGKNIEYSSLVPVFDEVFGTFIDNIKGGIKGDEWTGELALSRRGIFFSCHIAPTVFDDGHKGVSVILEDITRRKEDEARIQDSEARYRLLAEASNDLIYMIGRDDRVEYVNSFAAGICGKSPAEIIGKPRSILFPPEQAHHQGEQLQKVIASGTTLRSEGAIVVNGAVRWFDHFLAPVPDGHGGIRSVFGVSRDITSRKNAEDTLKQSEERFRRIFEDGPLGMAMVDANFRFTIVNRKFCQQLGYTAEELLTKTFMDITHPSHVDKDILEVRKLYEGKSDIYRTEKRYLTKSGSVIWGSVTITPLRGTDGSVHSTIALIEDITGIKRTGARLIESEKKFRDFADLLPQSVWECDLLGHLVFANQGSFTMYRYTPADFECGLTIWQMISPADRPMVSELVAQSLSKPPIRFPTAVEYTALRKDGSTFPVKMYVSPVTSNAAITGMRGIGIDMTEQKRSEEILRENESRFRDLITMTPDIIWQTDAMGRFVYVSPQAEEMLGYTLEDLIGHTLFEFLDPACIEQNRHMFAEAGRLHQKRVLFESRLRDRTGSTVLLENHATPYYSADGTFAGFRGISRVIPGRARNDHYKGKHLSS
ncbi:MAG: PAS domain S-box protein [Methanoregula sp.]